MSHSGFATVRRMKYTSQHYCDKTMDNKMALSQMLFSELYKIVVIKVTFAGFRVVIATLDPPMIAMILRLN